MKKTLILLVGLMVMAALSFAYAQDIPQDVSKNVLDGAKQASPLNWQSNEQVWETGIIDRIDEDGIVIGDLGYHWSKYGTRFRDLDGAILTRSDFGQGTEVTFVLEKDRKTIVTLIKGRPTEDEK